MIFRENSVKNGVEKDGDLFYFFHYIASRNNTNNFDKRSYIFLMKFKYGDDDAVQFVFNQLNPHLNNTSFAVCTVPPHKKDRKGADGPHKLAEKIIQSMSFDNKKIIDATDCILRTQDAKPRKFGDDIEFKDTLIINNIDKIKDRDVLLIDDVYTTGKTIGYIENLLKANGAGKVIKFVVCKTLKPGQNFSVFEPKGKKGYIIDVEDVIVSKTELREQKLTNINPNVLQTIKKLDNYVSLSYKIQGANRKLEKETEVCLVTSGKRKNIESIARELDIDKIIDCRDGKTHTERILAAKTLLQTYERNTFVIGSTDFEMQIAKTLKMNAILVKWFHQDKEFYRDIIITSAEEFVAEKLLQSNRSASFDRKETNIQEPDNVHELYHNIFIDINLKVKEVINIEQNRLRKVKNDVIKNVPIKVSNAAVIQLKDAKNMDEMLKMLKNNNNAKRMGKPNVRK